MKNVFLILSILICHCSFAQDNADKIIGSWYSDAKDGRVSIYKVDNVYFGRLEYLKRADDNAEKPLLDVNNPDISERNQPLIGLVFLTDFKYDSKKNRWKGKLYDYDGKKGKTCNSYLIFNEDGTLNLRGYIGMIWMGLNRDLLLTKVPLQ